ncbi:MAG: PAS domain S-box protein [Planctomycetes bacterium]|nr:PAS domain S-box protein [Planctomycetota bacterium]
MTDSRTLRFDAPAYLRGLVESFPAAVFVHDLDGRFVDANQRACDSLGYTRDELLQLYVRDVEKGSHLSLTDLWQAVRSGEAMIAEGRHRHADGSTFPVTVRLRPLVIEGEKLVCAFVESRDEAPLPNSLDESQRLELSVFREIFYVANEAVCITDHQGYYLLQNPAHERLLGYTDSELAGRTPAVHLGPQTFEEIFVKLSNGEAHRGEHIARTKAGEEIRVEISAFCVRPGPDEPPLFVGIKRELGERARERNELLDRKTKALEEELRQAQKMELIGRLAAGVAHDFNNLLTPILGYVDFELERSMMPDEGLRSSLREIGRAATRGKELTRQLLAFGRKQMLRKQVLDLADVIPSAERMLRRLITKRVDIRVDVEPGISPILADRTTIEQVLMNLATNADDAMPSGGTITIRARNVVIDEQEPLARSLGRGGTFVEISVTDDGEGMTEDTMQRIFEPFFTDKSDGTGLGLSIVHGIVQQHGGCIRVESERGVGSTFRVVLPPTDERVSTPTPEPPAQGVSRGRTILVAEDEPQVRQLVRRVLEDRGFHVLLADDGEEALAVARRHDGEIDLLLTDVVMPRLGGRGLYEALSQERPGLYAIFMTGYAGDALGDGPDSSHTEVLEKPFSANVLVDRIVGVLEARTES